MAFTTRACQKLRTKLNPITGIFCLLLLCATQMALANGFTIRSVSTNLAEEVYSLDADIRYSLTDEVKEALENGVPIVIFIDVEVTQERGWWFDKTIAELQQGYLIFYHALTESYVVTNLNSGAQENFISMESAIRSVGQIKDFPLIDKHLVEQNKSYYIELKTYLDLESLPTPMRPLAYISSNWRLESDWYQWPLQQ